MRANAAADPVLRSLNLEGIPWRFSGTSGLYARPEVRLLLSFLRAIVDPARPSTSTGWPRRSCTARAASTSSPSSTWPAAGTAICEVLEELGRQPGILRLSPETRAAASQLVVDLRRYIALANERPAGEVLFAFLRGTGWLARWP